MNFIALQNTSQEIELALFTDGVLRTLHSASKIDASKNLIPLLQSLLDSYSLTLTDLSFIAVNQGPGPFTTLRTIIATANGISFATKLPLIGIDGLDALLLEHASTQFPVTVALLNAFAHDVYFGIYSQSPFVWDANNAEKIISPFVVSVFYAVKNVSNHQSFLETLNNRFPTQQISFIGDATQQYTEQIKALFGKRAHIRSPLPHFPSLAQIGAMALEQWEKKATLSHQIMPIYLKKPVLF